jgi:hypothetical protein
VFRAVLAVLRPGGWYHSESGARGNVPRMSEVVDEIMAGAGLPVEPPYPDVGDVFELEEAAGFDVPAGGVQAVAQRRSFTREELVGVLETQPAVGLRRSFADPAAADAAVERLLASVDRMRRADGSYDQTFVRLDILARRPSA